MTNIDVLIAIVVAGQSLGTAWIHYQVNKNACGGPKCIETLRNVSMKDSKPPA